MRLNAYLSQAGIPSRCKADLLIKAGRVTVNGKTGQLNDNINDSDKVEIDSQPVDLQKLRYTLFNKPIGVVTTVSDPQNRKTVISLVKTDEKIVPVGRLDQGT